MSIRCVFFAGKTLVVFLFVAGKTLVVFLFVASYDCSFLSGMFNKIKEVKWGLLYQVFSDAVLHFYLYQ